MLLLVTLFQSRGQADGQNSYSDASVQGNPQIREWPQLQPHSCDQGEHAGEADKQRVNTTRPPTTQRHDSLSIAGKRDVGFRMSDVGIGGDAARAAFLTEIRQSKSDIPLHRSSPIRCSFIRFVVPGRPMGWPATNTTLSPFFSDPRSHSSASESVSISSVEATSGARIGNTPYWIDRCRATDSLGVIA